MSVSMPIFFDSRENDTLGVVLMFLLVGVGVGCIIFSGFIGAAWEFISQKPCRTDMSTAEYIKQRQRKFDPIKALCVTIGIVLCIICCLPCVIFTDDLGPVLLFVIVAIGVFLIVYPNIVSSGYKMLVDMGSTSKEYNIEVPLKYKSKTAETVMTMYWPTVTCIYLIASFLTFRWGLTWLIWVIAGVFHKVVEINCLESED